MPVYTYINQMRMWALLHLTNSARNSVAAGMQVCTFADSFNHMLNIALVVRCQAIGSPRHITLKESFPSMTGETQYVCRIGI